MVEKRFEELRIGVKDFKEGDIVLQRSENETYIIKRFGKTFFHKHKFIEVIWSDGYSYRYYMYEITGKRTVLRRID